ncbi:MAG TPA: penicillin-binding protein 1C [Gemmatimonadales bacterium]
MRIRPVVWARRGAVTLVVTVAAFVLLPRVIPHQPLRARFATSTAVYDAGGGLLRLTLSADDKYRVWVPLERISPLLVQATLLQEDQHFWMHPGVNPFALARGAWHTYGSGGRREGGSTVTMQLARMLYGIRSSTPLGKAVQVARAVELELCHTKREILEAYLNLVPYGGNVEGAAAASLIYYGKDPAQLTLPEALTLAALPQNPTRRSPGGGADADAALREARAVLYARWRAAHPPEPGEAGLMRLAVRMGSPADLPFRAPHLVDEVLADGPAAPEIRTTLDRRLQDLLEREIRNYVARESRLGVHNAAAMLVDSRTMAVQALVGSADFFDDRIAGQVNGTTAKRSPGSTLKPFIYALALDQGVLQPMTVLKDAPSAFGAYSPENFDGRFVGPVSAKDALIRSRNVPAVYVASQLSQPDLYGFLQLAGVAGLKSRDYYGLALVLGGGELTMEELVTLYGSLTNDGVVRPVRYRADQAPAAGVQVLSAEASYITRDMLKDNPRPDNLPAAAPGRVAVYWKTGTSYGFHDAWSVGIFGPYLLAVWVGNFDGEGNPAFVGVQVAAPLFFQVVDAVEAVEPAIAEPIRTFPPGLARVEVCAASGDLPNAECPRTVPTWFIPGKSPIRVSTLHQAVWVDDRTGLRDCPPVTPGPAHRVVYEMWGSDMLRLFQEAGLPRRVPPRYDPRCEAGVAAVAGGPAPQITSPLRGVVYSLRARELGQESIPLRATTGAGVREVYWFVGRRFLGQAPPGENFSWRPTAPGSFLVRAVDDQGQADARLIELAVVP